MLLVEELRNLRPDYFIITGDGHNELKILRALSKKYNGFDLILYFPLTSLPSKTFFQRRTGLSSLNVIKHIPGQHNINSIIYIVDGDTFNLSAHVEISDYLRNIGIEVVDISPIQDAFLIKCRFGNYNIQLYCIISGPQTCIEEEIAKLIEITLRITINLSGERNTTWKKRVKKEINEILRENNTKLENLIRDTEMNNLEISFPSICAVFKNLEEST